MRQPRRLGCGGAQSCLLALALAAALVPSDCLSYDPVSLCLGLGAGNASCGPSGALRSRKLLLLSLSIVSDQMVAGGQETAESEADLVVQEGALDAERSPGASESRSRIQRFIIDASPGAAFDGGDAPPVDPRWLERAFDRCPPPGEAEAGCGNNVHARNVIFQHCAPLLGGAAECCPVLEGIRAGPEWRAFKACACTSQTVCAVGPFVDLDATFDACGLPLDNLPQC